jgi:hypothetical protein
MSLTARATCARVICHDGRTYGTEACPIHGRLHGRKSPSLSLCPVACQGTGQYLGLLTLVGTAIGMGVKGVMALMKA